MSEKAICFCVHDCSRCVTYLATIRNDADLRRQSQQFYIDEFGYDIPLIIAPSDYIFRKPNRFLFELALRKAGFDAHDMWYCGGNPQADAEGSVQVGIFPVWYDNDTGRNYKDRPDETAPQCEHLNIRGWDEMNEALEALK
jgi:FMN phosphatase YigB (HAD superfamily)